MEGFIEHIQNFLGQYGWFLIIFLIIYKLFFTSTKLWIQDHLQTNDNKNLDIPPNNDYRLQEIRQQQQHRFNRLTEVAIEQNLIPNNTEQKKKDEKFKKTSAYRYASTGQWSSGKPRPGSSNDGGSYKPSPQSRYGGRFKGGGG